LDHSALSKVGHHASVLRDQDFWQLFECFANVPILKLFQRHPKPLLWGPYPKIPKDPQPSRTIHQAPPQERLEEAEELYRFVLQGLVQHYGAAGGVINIFKIQLGIIAVNWTVIVCIVWTCNFRSILDYTLCRLDSMGYCGILLVRLWIWWGWGTLMVFVELVWFWERFDPLPDLLWILGISTWHRDIYRLSMDILPDASQAPGEEDMLSISCQNKLAAVLQQERTLDARYWGGQPSLFLSFSCTSPKYIDRTVIYNNFGGILLLYCFDSFWGLLERFENVCLGCFLWITTCSWPKEVCRECRALQDTFCSVSTELVKQQHFFSQEFGTQ